MTQNSDKFDELVNNLAVHEEMPIEIPDRLRRSVWLGVLSTSVGIPLWWATGEPLAQILVPLNVIGLLMLFAVLFASSGMTQPVTEGWHQLAWMASVPSAVNVFATGVGAIILIVLIILGIIAAVILLWIIGAALSS